MVALPPRPEQVVIDRIYESIKQEKSNSELYLGRLGASFIGEDCIRKIWFSWRSFTSSSFDGRILRLFETGHLQEDRIVNDLRRAGFQVWDRDEDGKQFERSDDTGHFVTKVDGIMKGVPDSEEVAHLLEVKTHNKDSFNGLNKKGVQDSKPTHYSQMQYSMALMGLNRGMYVAVCKDNEQFYVERIREDRAEQKKLSTKVIKLIEAKMRPAGISDDASSFGCKFCEEKAVCLKQKEPLKTCRSCVNSAPTQNGSWTCLRDETVLTQDQQRAACEHYEVL